MDNDETLWFGQMYIDVSGMDADSGPDPSTYCAQRERVYVSGMNQSMFRVRWSVQVMQML